MGSQDDTRGTTECLSVRSLDELEAQILDIVWDLEPPVSPTRVYEILRPNREVSQSTISLIMSKLSREGILGLNRTGDKETDVIVYYPLVNRATMFIKLVNSVAKQLYKGKNLDEVLAELTNNPIISHDVHKLLKSAEEAV